MLDFFERLDTPIDFHGQELSKKFFYIFIIVGYTISLLTGIIYSNLKYTLYLGVMTVFSVFIICVPSWPFYKKNPVKFLSKD